MRIVAISDTHSQNPHTKWKIPEGDVLVHAGDGTAVGSEQQVEQLARWLGRLPHPRKLYVPGNHDRLFLTLPLTATGILEASGVEVLMDRGVRIDGLLFWGSPWLAWRGGHMAFERPDVDVARALIPAETHVLITHSPPYGILDYTPIGGGDQIGCSSLANHVYYRIRPRVHIFGHCHYSGGREVTLDRDPGAVRFINAALVDDFNRPLPREPFVIDLESEGA